MTRFVEPLLFITFLHSLFGQASAAEVNVDWVKEREERHQSDAHILPVKWQKNKRVWAETRFLLKWFPQIEERLDAYIERIILELVLDEEGESNLEKHSQTCCQHACPW